MALARLHPSYYITKSALLFSERDAMRLKTPKGKRSYYRYDVGLAAVKNAECLNYTTFFSIRTKIQQLMTNKSPPKVLY